MADLIGESYKTAALIKKKRAKALLFNNYFGTVDIDILSALNCRYLLYYKVKV